MEEAQEGKLPEGAGSPPSNPSLKQIRTFQGDVATALERQRESLYSIQETERLKRASGGTVPDTSLEIPGKRKQFLLLLLGSFFLIGLGIFGAWFAYNEFLRKTAPPILIVPENRFITAQNVSDIDLTGASRESLLTSVSDKSSGLSAGELRHLVLRKTVGLEKPLITAAEFFGILQSSAPGSLIRSFEPAFMLGSIGRSDQSTGSSLFIIFKLASFENAFPGMLAWEKKVADDIGPLFATAPLLKNIGSESVFKDTVSKNKDARVLFAPVTPGSTTTTPILLYSFFDNKMLIITDSLETLKILIDRLTQASLVH